MALVTLVEATAWNAATGAPVEVRLAGGGRRHYRHKGRNDWRGGVVDRPRVTSRLDYGEGGFTGGAIPTVSAIGFMPSRRATVNELAALNWKGATITVSTGDDAAADPAWVVELRGTVAGYAYAGGLFSFTVSSLGGRLAKPLVTGTFAGTGGLECAAAATGRVKRRSWGPCWNVEGRIADPASNLWEFGDPAFPLQAFDQVKDKGRPGPLVLIAWQGSAAATLAALTAAAPPQGGGAVAPSIARVKWWRAPSAPLTADIRGEVGAGYVETVGAIAARIAGIVGVPAADATPLDLARPDAAGLHVEDAGETAAAALDRLLLPASLAWGVTPAGDMSITPIGFADPVDDVVANTVEREAVFAPLTVANVGYRRNHRRHGDGEISAAVLAEDVTFADGRTVQHLQPATPGATAGAPIGTTIGGTVQPDGSITGGRPVPEVLLTLDKIAPLAVDVSDVRRANIDQDALLRQEERARVQLAAAQIGSLLDQRAQRITFRDAGMLTDPDTGRIYLYGQDQNDKRVSKVEVGLNAVTGEIAFLARVDDVRTMIAQAQLSPADAAQFGDLIRRINAAEVSLSGLHATIALKADAVTVTQLGGIVRQAVQTIDALAGEVAQRVTYADFNPLVTRVGLTEQTLASYGDVSSYQLTLRQAELRNTAAAAAGIAGIVSTSENVQRSVLRAAELHQQFTVTLAEARAVEAMARLGLAAEVAGSKAGLVEERLTRADEISAQARRTDLLTAQVADQGATIAQQGRAIVDANGARTELAQQLRAEIGKAASDAAEDRAEADRAVLSEVTRVDRAVSDERGARAGAITQVRADVEIAFAAVEDRIEVEADRLGKVEARRTTAIDVNGNLVGTVLIGSDEGPGALGLINADLRMGTGRVVFDTGAAMQVQGIGFGANGDLVEWFGPSMPINQCTTANAVTYKTTAGRAYSRNFLAGAPQNERQSTQLAADASVIVGPFATNGRRKTVVASYFYEQGRAATSPGSISGSPSATLVLERMLAGGGWGELTRFNAAGQVQHDPSFGPEEPGYGRQSMSASVTFTDNSSERVDFSYRLRIVARQLASFNFSSPNAGTEQQTLSLSSVEDS